MKRETHIFKINDIAKNICTIFFKKNHKSANFKETGLKEIFLFKWAVKKPFVIFILEKRNKKLQVFIGFLILIPNKHANNLGK